MNDLHAKPKRGEDAIVDDLISMMLEIDHIHQLVTALVNRTASSRGIDIPASIIERMQTFSREKPHTAIIRLGMVHSLVNLNDDQLAEIRPILSKWLAEQATSLTEMRGCLVLLDMLRPDRNPF